MKKEGERTEGRGKEEKERRGEDEREEEREEEREDEVEHVIRIRWDDSPAIQVIPSMSPVYSLPAQNC